MVTASDRSAVSFSLSGGAKYDSPEGMKLLFFTPACRICQSLLMDRAYEGDKMRAVAKKLGYNPVVPPKKNRIDPWEYDRILYKRRNEVERFFRRIKHFRRVFTRYDKLDIVFAGFILFAMIFDSLVGTDSKSSRRKGYCYYENPSDQNLLSLFSSYSTAAYSPFACRNFGSCFHLCSTASASA